MNSKSIPQEMNTELSHLIQPHVLESERLRARTLLIISIALVCMALLVSWVPGLLPPDNGPRYQSALRGLILLLLFMGGYEAAMTAWLARLKTRNQAPSTAIKYLGCAFEIGIATLILWDWSDVAGLTATVGGVLPWLYFPFIAVSVLHLDRRLCWFSGAMAAIGFATVALSLARTPSELSSLVTSNTSYGLKSLVLLISGGVAAFVAGQLRSHLCHAIESTRERDRAIGIFGQHVSPQVAQRLIAQAAATSAEQRHVCVLFLDIRGFSSMASQHSPAEVMEYLNALFAPMISIVNQHGGIVNKFLGDGFMAVFGAPFEDPELHRNAVRCSLALLDCVTRLNQTQSIPLTRIGIGIHAGDAMAGTVGSSERKEYTLLGDTVNTAARIEQETKKHGSNIIVSDAVLSGLNDEAQRAKDLGEVALRGIAKPLRLYQLS